MKTLKEYLLEDYSSPDHIDSKYKEANVRLNWQNDCARAFVYVENKDAVIKGNISATHNDIFNNLSLYTRDTKLSKEDVERIKHIYNHNYDAIRPDTWQKEDPDEWFNYLATRGPQEKDVDSLLLGRLWLMQLNGKSAQYVGKSNIIVIAWWPEMKSNQLHKDSLRVVNSFLSPDYTDFGNDRASTNIDDYLVLCVDNNGDLFELDTKEIKEIDKRSDTSKKLIGIDRDAHTATQEEKRVFFANFRKDRDERNQKVYNHTRSHTEAEYRSIKYQGDSLEDNTKPLKD